VTHQPDLPTAFEALIEDAIRRSLFSRLVGQPLAEQVSMGGARSSACHGYIEGLKQAFAVALNWIIRWRTSAEATDVA
jgi:hypothetical protein